MNSTCILIVLFLAIPNLVSSQLCEHLEIIPHPQWCSAFFLCRFGFWTVLVCPGGLFYNPEIRRCDFPENVECVNDPDLTTPEWTSPEWTFPNDHTFTTPSVPTFSTPSIPTFSTPSIPTFSTPSIPTFSTPSIPTFSTPSIPTFSTPSIPTFSTPSIPTFSTPSIPTFSTPSIPTFSTPSIPTFSTPTIPTFSTPDRPTIPEFTTPTRPSIPTRSNAVTTKKSCSDATHPFTLPHALCQYFYKCINDNAIQMKCVEGLLWNSNPEHCDFPENVNCSVV